MSRRANGVMHMRIEGISVRAVRVTMMDQGTDEPGAPGICSTPPIAAGAEAEEIAGLRMPVGSVPAGAAMAGAVTASENSTHSASLGAALRRFIRSLRPTRADARPGIPMQFPTA